MSKFPDNRRAIAVTTAFEDVATQNRKQHWTTERGKRLPAVSHCGWHRERWVAHWAELLAGLCLSDGLFGLQKCIHFIFLRPQHSQRLSCPGFNPPILPLAPVDIWQTSKPYIADTNEISIGLGLCVIVLVILREGGMDGFTENVTEFECLGW